MTFGRLIMVFGSIIVSAVSVFLILREVPISSVIDSIGKADPFQLLLALGFVTLSLFTRGIRWWGLLGYRLDLPRAAHIVNVMSLGNQLPLRLGEVARSLLAAHSGVPLATAAASIVIERLVDTLVVVLMIAATVSTLPDVPIEVTQSATLFGVIALAGFLVLLAFARYPQYADSISNKLMDMAPLLRRLPLHKLISNLLDGMQALTSVKTFLFTTLWTLIAWAASLATFYVLFNALGIQADVVRSVPLGVSLAALSVAIPVSIAALGPFEGSIILTGQIVAMDSIDAVSLGFLFHGISVLGYIIWGVIGLLALGVSPTKAFASSSDDVGEEP